MAPVAKNPSVDYGQEEAIATYGSDPRSFAIRTKAFAATAKEMS